MHEKFSLPVNSTEPFISDLIGLLLTKSEKVSKNGQKFEFPKSKFFVAS